MQGRDSSIHKLKESIERAHSSSLKFNELPTCHKNLTTTTNVDLRI